MPIGINDIQPALAPAVAPALAPPTVPALPTAAPTPAPDTKGENTPKIPDDVLRIPAFNGLLQGKPAAIYAPTGVKNPELAAVVKHGKELIAAGFGFYEGKSLPVNVLYNTLFITPEQIAAADAAGKLETVAEPFDQVKASFEAVKNGGKNAADNSAAATPETPTTPPASTPPAIASAGAPPPASVLNKLATARTNNLQPGSPNGAGRLLSAIQRPVI